MKRRRKLGTVVRWGFIALLLVWSLFPIFWNVSTSLKSRRDLFAEPPKLVFEPVFDGYAAVFEDVRNQFWASLQSSTIVSLLTTLGVILIASLAAYAFSRYSFRFRGVAFSGFLASRLLPPIVAVLPLYLLANAVNLLDTHMVLVMIYVALLAPLAIWLMRQYFDSIPYDIEEAAQIDGASRLRVLRHVTLPLAAPGVLAVAILMFVEAWNEFMFALIFTSVTARTLPLLLAQGRGDLVTDFQGIAALATMQMIPVFILAVVANRYLVGGLTAGAVK